MHIRTLTSALALSAAFTFAAPAFADERPPRFDSDGLCNSRALTPEGFSPESKTACVSAQADALAAIRRIWPATLGSIQDDCSHQAKADDRDGDYQVLDACLRAQNRQQQANQEPLARAKAKAKPAITSK